MIRILRAGQTAPSEIFDRSYDVRDISGAVAEIIRRVREEGDEALLSFTEEFDGVRPESLEVPAEKIREALAALDPAFKAVLEEAAENIRAFHRLQLSSGFISTSADGTVAGQRVIPLDRVGVYIPGGTAAYPSTVLMDVIPAKIAGCGEVVMVSPPTCGGDIHPVILAAAAVAGVDRVFRCGGAQAVAALAWGTESVPRVDKIVGPGNAVVAEAKRQVFGQVGIDTIAGPSEILVIADGASDPRHIAADMLSQAEHDKLASAVLVTDSEALAKAAAEELERQLSVLPREEIARASIENNGKIIITENLDQAVEIANEIAPEHLELCVDEPFALLGKVTSAGSIFMGRNCPEAVGDYFAGLNHTLPTGGAPRFDSPLGVDDFVKKSQFVYYGREALERDAEKIALFARREGLEAHARSVLSRFEKEPRK